MEVVLPILTGGLYAAGFFMMMRRSIVKLIIGLVLISHATNLLIFSMGKLVRGHPPIIAEGELHLLQPVADPLPQALILTAIVISFGLQAFAIVLIGRSHEALGTDDLDRMQTTETLDPPERTE